MPKTKKEIEQLVRKFYNNLTSAYYEDNQSDADDLKDRSRKFTVTEEEIQMAIDSYSQQDKQADAQKYLHIREVSSTMVEDLREKYGIVPEVPFERVVNHVLDYSGTPEAEAKNVELLRRLAKRENFQQFIREQINNSLNFDMSILANTNPSDGVKLFLDPRTSIPLSAAFIGVDLIGSAAKAGVELSEETQGILKFNSKLIGSHVSSIGVAQKALSKDEFACINPNINAIKEILADPSRYSALDDIEEFDMLQSEYLPAIDKTSFGVKDHGFEMARQFDLNGIPKTADMLNNLEKGMVQSFTHRDGRKMMVQFKNENFVCWERTIPAPALTAADTYETVHREAASLFECIERDALAAEGNSKEFNNVLEAAQKLRQAYNGGLMPDSLEKADEVDKLCSDLESAVKKYNRTVPNEALSDPLIKKQLEFSDGCSRFLYTEKACRQNHVAGLEQNVFATKLARFFKEHPEYDFDPASHADSLRIRSFALYKNMNTNVVQEETDYLLTDYEHKKLRPVEIDKKLHANAFDLLNSQHTLYQSYGEANIRLLQSAKNFNAVVYPSDGNVQGARLLYIDKDGNPALSGKLLEIPQLGNTLAQMDKLRNEGKGYADFPPAPKFVARPSEEVQREHSAINAKREAMAQALYAQNCKDFFPGAKEEDLQRLTSSALSYSAARQSFVFSEYGQVYLTEEQMEDEALVAAANAQKENAIAAKAAQDLYESKIMIEAKLHPEYYRTREQAEQRQIIARAYANLQFEAAPEREDEDHRILADHHFESAATVDAFLRAEKLDIKKLTFYNGNGVELPTGENPQPWDTVEQLGGLIDKGQPIYYTKSSGRILYKAELHNGDLVTTEDKPGREFNEPGDSMERSQTCENIENLLNEMLATGTTSRDSAEYQGMVAAAREALAVAQACNTDDPTPKAILARAKLDAAKTKMADAADKYFVAKADQSMNSRRANRFAIAMKARHIADENYLQEAHNPAKLMKEAIATKICKVEANKIIKRNTVMVKEARAVLSNRTLMKAQSDALRNTDAFKAMTSKRDELNKLFKSDASKLSKKYRDKAVEIKQAKGKAL